MPGKAARRREYRPGRLAALDSVLSDCGWAQVGGHLLRDADERVCGRTPWIPRAPWWEGRPEGLTERRAHQVVGLALEGRQLGDRQVRYLAWLLSIADDYLAGRAGGEVEGEGSVSSGNAGESDPEPF